MGNRDCAKKLYDTILEVYPRFTDCLLRLDCMLRDRGHEADAIKMFDKGNIHLKKREWVFAQKKYEKVMGMPGLKNDPYAFLSMGNIFMSNLASVASGTSSPSEKKKHHNSLSFDKETVSDYEKFCGDTLTKASYHLEFERQKEEKRRLEIETQCKLLREYEERVAREQEEARVKEDDLRRRHEAIQLKQDERLK
ncbi:hypothetical protein Pcac1_g28649 [Phytophthora cactorum]|uniref:Tetratricopeptide repeat n=1 Tax=Phytophthora cactorum TaxID=29920 RepID=A0A8T1AIU2_9STRA|nr:hypothetical protein Pcac1_g28649 [Phytophthora cactorum]KAG2875942.1 hypothetical protein PC114_g24453 [Phytophthora cactorum]KAG2883627.1 hypothetical protein PC115_g21562 [Phytophthora cactorum]KAG3054195.1 hypothetical protein PC122_g22111 [Phytophthora cactorum]